MKRTLPRSLDDVVGIAARYVGGWQHFFAASAAIMILLLLEPVHSMAPRLVLGVLAWTASFAGTMAWSYHKAYGQLLGDLAPLMQDAEHAIATLSAKESEMASVAADRDRWRSAVERAAGGSVGETPTELIARQALRIRTLEREHAAAGPAQGGDRL